MTMLVEVDVRNTSSVTRHVARQVADVGDLSTELGSTSLRKHARAHRLGELYRADELHRLRCSVAQAGKTEWFALDIQLQHLPARVDRGAFAENNGAVSQQLGRMMVA